VKEYYTTVSADSMVGEDYTDKDGIGKVRDITFFDLLHKCGFISEAAVLEGNALNFDVVWTEEDVELSIHEITDADSGEVYWWDKSYENWTEMDEKLITNLIMWGDFGD
jgi:hypothetical protein